jgi:membrane protease YdiL (CAAX protease family)
MISVAVQPRAARLTLLVLLAAAVRAALVPIGEPLSTGVFVACLGAVVLLEARPGVGERGWSRGRSVLAGSAVGALLIAPAVGALVVGPAVGALPAGPAVAHGAALPVGAGLPGRTLSDFWAWGAVAAVVAALEEIVIRGWLQPSWTAERGPVAGLILAAAVFAMIHLPRYGVVALPLDFSVGLALGGLRLLSGRVLPCAVAHVIADWGAWFLA